MKVTINIEWTPIEIKKFMEKHNIENINEEIGTTTYDILSTRTTMCLINWWITHSNQLEDKSEAALSSIKWFWKKAMIEVCKLIKDRWLSHHYNLDVDVWVNYDY